jgi:hypothetical protein
MRSRDPAREVAQYELVRDAMSRAVSANPRHVAHHRFRRALRRWFVAARPT